MGSTDERPEPETAEVKHGRGKPILPGRDKLLAELIELAPKVDAIARFLDAIKTREFKHPDGRVDRLETVGVREAEGAVLSHLARHCPTPLSVEVGFGMGSSAAVILGTRDHYGHSFEHYVFDPFGLGETDDRGKIVESYLNDTFGDRFRRVWERSEVGLGALAKEHGPGSVGLIFIDGAHRFEHVMADFLLSDLLCCEGGFITFDDAWFPAIETVINYVATNRPDYAVHHLIVENMSLLQKVHSVPPEWSSFKPFPVPGRKDWTPKYGPRWVRPAQRPGG